MVQAKSRLGDITENLRVVDLQSIVSEWRQYWSDRMIYRWNRRLLSF